MKKLSIALFLFFYNCQPCFAGVFVTLGVAQVSLKEKDCIFLEKPALPFFNLGYSQKFGDVILAAQTNRLSNIETNQKVFYKGQKAKLQTSTISDTFLGGYKINQFMPSIFVSSVRVNRRLIIGKNTYDKKAQSLVAGVNLGYFVNKNISVAAFIAAPNKALSLKTYTGFGLNYFF